MSELKINKDELYKFAYVKNMANFGVLKCVNLLNIKERMIPNIGLYSFIPTFIAYIVCIILFIKVDFKIIKKKIKDLLYAILNLKYIENSSVKPINGNYLRQPIFIYVAQKKNLEISNALMRNITELNNKYARQIKRNTIRNLKKNLGSEDKKTEDFTKSTATLNNNNSPPIKKPNYCNNKKVNEMQLSKMNNSKKNKIVRNSIKVNKKLSEQEVKRIKGILAYNDRELNDLDFKSALKYDNRNMIKI